MFLWLNYVRLCMGICQCQMLLLEGDFRQWSSSCVGTYASFSESSEVLLMIFLCLCIRLCLSNSVLNLVIKALKWSRGFSPCAVLPALKWPSEELCPSAFLSQAVLLEPQELLAGLSGHRGFLGPGFALSGKCHGSVSSAASCPQGLPPACHCAISSPWRVEINRSNGEAQQ